MISHRTRRLWPRAAFLLTTLVLTATACAENAPQDALDPAGPIARQQDNLFMPVFWIAVAVFVLVQGLLLYSIVRFRQRREGDVGKQTHGNMRLEIAWTIAPAVLLAGIAIPTVLTIFSLDAAGGDDPMRVNVLGKQWWWEYTYEDIKATAADGTQVPLVTANELHIPTGRPVLLELEAADVIHSFWVPRLAGKQDLVPGRLNHLVIEADAPGVYPGQCAEFCALSHANMRLRVIAHDPADFDAWVREQQEVAELEVTGLAAEGAGLFYGEGGCLGCHAIRGTYNDQVAQGRVGPDLTHLWDRSTFGGAMYEMNEENMRLWLADPQAAKPGNLMVLPRTLTEQEIEALIAFLKTLR